MRKLTDLDKIVREKIQRLEKTAFKTIAAETKNFVKENFKKQGFQAASLQPWKPRKTTDAKGRDLLFYKRGKRKGRLTKFGRRHEGRAILIGHYSGNKMRDSFRAVRSGNKLRFIARHYAPYHNEGKGHLPQRKMIGESPLLTKRIKQAIDNSFGRGH